VDQGGEEGSDDEENALEGAVGTTMLAAVGDGNWD
jgi:hypothetical protein